VVDPNSTPAPANATAAPAQHYDNTLPIAGGAVALLVVGGAAYALTRRRRQDDEEWIADEPSYDEGTTGAVTDEPADAPMMHETEAAPMIHEEQPAMISPPPSAFAWGTDLRTGETSRTAEPMVEEERNPGESWIDRAYRGPSPSNPSVSLKARLKRAAFFDKRERDAAAGTAEPIDTTAGLPDALVEEQENELA
jgi:hypothetical protein